MVILGIWETLAPSTGAGLVTAAATLLTAFGVLFGGLAVLLPAMRRLKAQVDETHRQVSVNGHSDPDNPTVPDRIDDVARDVSALARVMDAHLEWSDRWTSLMERELELARTDREGTEHDENSRHETGTAVPVRQAGGQDSEPLPRPPSHHPLPQARP